MNNYILCLPYVIVHSSLKISNELSASRCAWTNYYIPWFHIDVITYQSSIHNTGLATLTLACIGYGVALPWLVKAMYIYMATLKHIRLSVQFVAGVLQWINPYDSIIRIISSFIIILLNLYRTIFSSDLSFSNADRHHYNYVTWRLSSNGLLRRCFRI